MATKKSQRIAIWVIAITMAVGTLGGYFVIIIANDNSQEETNMADQQTQSTDEADKKPLEVDPTAYTVKDDVTELKIEDLKVGTGDEAKPGDNVKVHYKGTLAKTGAKFDSSYDRGEPISFGLGQVIVGWQEGIPGMKVGGKRRLIIPSDKAYGAQAVSTIPANSDLVFEVELLGTGEAVEVQQ